MTSLPVLSSGRVAVIFVFSFLFIACLLLLSRFQLRYPQLSISTREPVKPRTSIASVLARFQPDLADSVDASKRIIVFEPNGGDYSVKLPPDKRCSLVRGRRIIATYASHGVHLEQATKACQAAVAIEGIDVCLVFKSQFLDQRFIEQNYNILSEQMGSGFWLWKPYLILRLLLAIDEDDVVLYLDADKLLINNIEQFICLQSKLRQDVVVFYQEQLESAWTKADAYLLMNVEHLFLVNETMQIYGSYLLLRKSFNSIRFVSEWLTYSQDSRIITDEASTLRKESPKFVQNRHDQSVLSLLAKRWNLASWPSPERDWYHPQSDGVTFRTFNSLNTTGLTFSMMPTKPIIARQL